MCICDPKRCGKVAVLVTTKQSVIFDQYLIWIDQINNIIRSIHGTLRVLRKFSRFTPMKVRKTLAEALSLSKINYCNVVYGQLPKYLINRL